MESYLVCPVCGHKPRVKVYRYGNTGYVCEIKCKPFLLPAHMKVSEWKPHKNRAIMSAIHAWNYEYVRYKSKPL